MPTLPTPTTCLTASQNSEPIEKVTPVLRECLAVAGEDLDDVRQVVRCEMDTTRRILGDPQVTVDPRGEFPDGSAARAACGLSGDVARREFPVSAGES